MRFRELRNVVICGLSRYLNVPVCLSSQVSPEQEYPFVVYSSTAPYIPDNGLGEFYQTPNQDGSLTEERREQPTCTFSFTVCSVNREDGAILGEDEALDLAESAQGWFLHAGYEDMSRQGLTVVEVSNVQERSFLQADEEARRYGFDVMIRYVRIDKRTIGTVREAATTGKGEN